MSLSCQVQTINNKTHSNVALREALIIQFEVQDTSQTHCSPPGKNRIFFPPSSFVIPFLLISNSPPFLSCPPFEPVLPVRPVE